MNGIFKDRAQVLGEFIVDTGATVRAAGKKFGVSKSTVHKDVTERLKRLSPELFLQVKEGLHLNEKAFLLLLFFEVVNFIFLWYYFCVKRRCFYGHKKKTKCASAPYNFAPPHNLRCCFVGAVFRHIFCRSRL